MDYTKLDLGQLAYVARNDWGDKVHYAAKPYLAAMLGLKTLDDKYMLESARSVVLYFLSNAGHWRGQVARDVKKELKRRLAEKKVQS